METSNVGEVDARNCCQSQRTGIGVSCAMIYACTTSLMNSSCPSLPIPGLTIGLGAFLYCHTSRFTRGLTLWRVLVDSHFATCQHFNIGLIKRMSGLQAFDSH